LCLQQLCSRVDYGVLSLWIVMVLKLYD
jgi:hypothetical protein